jgi:hypothetical protein
MMLWKLFGSEQRVQQALDQSIGYDISPNIIPQLAPANSDAPTLWNDVFIMPANTQAAPRRPNETRERRKA